MILVVGLSPAWQQIMEFDSFRPGEVNRARRTHWCASGKVINCSIALARLGVPHRMLTVVGGSPGGAVRRDLDRLGVSHELIETVLPTRICTTLLQENGPTTELVEETHPISSEEINAFVAAFRKEAVSAKVIVICGSSPANIPTDFWANLLDGFDGSAVLDFRGPLLESALARKPTLVKPNREELGATVHRSVESREDLFASMKELQQRGAQNILITDGKQPAHLLTETGVYGFKPPTVKVVNPIASGDCLTGGIAWRLSMEDDMVTAVRWGIACAAANVEVLLPARFERARVEQLFQQIKSETV